MCVCVERIAQQHFVPQFSKFTHNPSVFFFCFSSQLGSRQATATATAMGDQRSPLRILVVGCSSGVGLQVQNLSFSPLFCRRRHHHRSSLLGMNPLTLLCCDGKGFSTFFDAFNPCIYLHLLQRLFRSFDLRFSLIYFLTALIHHLSLFHLELFCCSI